MYLAGPDLTAVDFHLSDGQLPSLAQCSFSSCDPTKVLVPDFYFFRDHGYQGLRDWIARGQTPWKERSDDLVWRGRLTGAGLFSVDPAQKDNPLIRQRLRMAMHAKETPLDFGFVSAVTSLEEHILGKVGFMADRIEAKTWGRRKFAIDIDGFSSTWDNMFHRLLMGNCVLKVESQMGFRQWYYDRLRPYENFIPVKKYLSDLAEQIDWVLENDDTAQDIAHAGQQLAESMTWDAVAGETRQRLRRLVGLSE
ncbi:MAG: glycosyl transferase family 90 [Sulfitobacter sp.]|nr:glycosyl transferase family 90 [Sulfitobacter sp.]